MLSKNNTTVAAILNKTSPNQQNSSCIFVDSTAILCAYCFILLGSFFGNTFIIIIVYKHRDLQKTVNFFIVNMAVSDLLFSLIGIPHEIIVFVSVDSSHWAISGILGSIFCKLYYFAIPVSLLVSAQSLVWIAIDRFIAVVFPINRGLISTKIRKIAIVSTWIIGGLIYSPALITRELVKDGNITSCTEVNKSIFASMEVTAGLYHWFDMFFRFFAPLFLMTVLYTAIAISLKRQSKALADAASNVQRRSLKKRRQAIQMAVVMIVLFYICVIPLDLLFFLQLKPLCDFQRTFFVVAILMRFASTSVNPIICLSFVESYRHGLKNILCRPCSKWRNNKVAKREQITLEVINSIPRENCPQTSDNTVL
ncbi:QRFP-like peptide receptor [Oculina patagonica]